ncbi:MAG: MerR family transcriptional regulator [Gemmatimonadales bacterium]|nr:MAG: MerR family transcriptional regulator [Gemmatimonadales bacterium]
MATRDSSIPQYPMRVVVRRTGLNASLLRAWERRYAAVEPGRSDGGQRLYSDHDVQKLVLLRDLVGAGHNISQVADLDMGELRLLLRRDGRGDVGDGTPAPTADDDFIEARPRARLHPESTASSHLAACMAAMHAMDPRALEASLNRAAMGLSPVDLVDQVLVPLLTRIGLLWSRGEVRPATEHVASAVVRRFLDWLLETLSPRTPAPLMLVGTPAGHRHEFGSLLAAVVVAVEGWDVLNVGPDLPATEIAAAAETKNARMVALSAIHPGDDPHLPGELRALRRELPDDVDVVIGGPAAARHADALRDVGVEYLPSLEDLRSLSRNGFLAWTRSRNGDGAGPDSVNWPQDT